ncbi:PPE family protein [Mycobacterium tuberculosis]|uniref:PPE family protein n=1 Tax=Mycobacterium tuberculosis TaxID=1773 RepID=UPI001E2E7860|nr:PPE family protein [Mycobacterium tuberculosis]UDU02475.1 PPE family protein [Mycobacterium tuberculosis]
MHPMIPAEYISNIIYEGPGADSLFFASGQLRELAYSVETTAESLEDELDELDENWKGSSSDLLADAVERYLQWLTKHSNREEVHRLIASNVAGVNAPAIADLDAQYDQYRARNVAVMNAYVSWTRSALSDLPRWREPPQIYRGG